MKITKRIKGQVVGELTLTKLVGNEWEIQYLTVEPLHRGKGIASDLLKIAKSHALKKGLVLIGFIDPKKDGSLNHQQIKEWLVKHGFKHGWYDFTQAERRASYNGRTFNKRVLLFNE